MATIALYSNQIAQMSGKLGEVKKTVGDYKSELFSLKSKALAIKQSICNMEDVISSIQASTSVQEDKVESLEQVRGSSEQFIEDTYRIDGNVADLVNKRKDDFYEKYKYLKPDSEKSGWENFKDGCAEWCKEHWKVLVTVGLVLAAIAVIVLLPGAALLVAIAKGVLDCVFWGGVIGGIISAITGGSFWEGFEEGAFFGAIAGGIAGGMGFAFTGVINGVMKLGQMLLTGGVSGIGSILLGDLGDIVIKGEVMSLKKIVIDVVVAGVTGVVFAGIAYGLSKAFAALKLKMINKGGTSSVLDDANYAQKTYSKTFSPEGIQKYTELAGQPINTIDDLANAIKSGKISVSDLPVEYIVREGNTLILNTRTSQALTQAGIPRSQWSTINQTGNSFFEDLLSGQLSRNGLSSEGISTVRPSGGQ